MKWIRILLVFYILYQLATALWALFVIVLLGLYLLWTMLQHLPNKYSRAYGIARCASPFGARPEEIYRKVVMSEDPTIGEAEKNWASRQLEKLGRPIFYLPPKVVRRPTLVK